jgi:hypothetical protein
VEQAVVVFAWRCCVENDKVVTTASLFSQNISRRAIRDDRFDLVVSRWNSGKRKH